MRPDSTQGASGGGPCVPTGSALDGGVDPLEERQHVRTGVTLAQMVMDLAHATFLAANRSILPCRFVVVGHREGRQVIIGSYNWVRSNPWH